MIVLKWFAQGLFTPGEYEFYRRHLKFDVPPLTATMVGVSVVIFMLVQGGVVPKYAMLSPDLRVAPLDDIRTYLAMVWHIFGHANFDHLVANIVGLAIVGKSVDRHYSILTLTALVVTTAVLGWCTHYLQGVQGYGLSGVVFLYMALSLFSDRPSQDKLSLWGIVLVAGLVSLQIYGHFMTNDNISYLSHLAGALVGLNFIILSYQMEKYSGEGGDADLKSAEER